MNQTAEKLPTIINDKDVQIVQPSPMEMAQSFLQSGGDLESLEKMMVLQEKFDSMQAKKQFNKAMAQFKANPPKITKDKQNNQYKSMYTTLGNLVNSALPQMSVCGLSHKWEIDQSQAIKVTCIVTHNMGHSESVSMSAPPDGSGSKNPIQQIKSTITYLKSATFESIMGLASTDANFDDDGNSFGNKTAKKTFPERFSDVQKAHPETAQKVLERWGIKDLNEVRKKDVQDGLIGEVVLFSSSEWKEWQTIRDSNPAIENWQDPINIKQCKEAITQAKKALNL